MNIINIGGFINSTTNKAVNNHFVVYGKNDKIGDFLLLKSYDTIVSVYLLDYSKMIVNTNKYSTTTTKYINMFVNSKNYKEITKNNESDFNVFMENWIN